MVLYVLQTIDQLLQGAFVIATIGILVVKWHPGLAGFLKYGKTLQPELGSESGTNANANALLHLMLNMRVPKFWFYHFYVLLLMLTSIGYFITDRDIKLETIDPFIKYIENRPYGTIPLEVARMSFFLLMGHATRRFLETTLMMKYSRTSKMNIFHYLAGVFFYTAMSLQLFINTDFHSIVDHSHPPTFDPLMFLSIALFLLASTDQFLNHLHMSRLVKYNIPTYGLFKYVCCAHYFDEILIYLAVFGLAKNTTSFLGFLFTFVNLAVSASETHAFYKKRMDGKAVPKWFIVPYLL
ncbi:CYFA0S12e03400g1_1 [Cyberlindnera fabianii]|uniref:Polyprenal reductase n=1 Tax=Cyberlindnera fabianii TaxID=36022 RepID=A0A061B1L1_CYBFA|nr:Polyprenol reductase [Cyberlindnera fabianii]CDR43705.1 CYFA0S12e03400g1_1 [Cyberlindnera fabianii]